MTTTAALHPGWTVQLAIHRAVRRDLTRLSDALARSDAAIPPAVRAYWGETARQLHHHHILEDSAIWPLMAERLGPPVRGLLERNAAEHMTMAAAMDEFESVATATAGDLAGARIALVRLAQTVDTHLGHEERDVLPLIPDAFSAEDIAFFSAESGRTNPADRFLPWVLDGATDDDGRFFTGALPGPVRTTLDSRWMPQWLATVDDMTRTRVRMS